MAFETFEISRGIEDSKPILPPLHSLNLPIISSRPNYYNLQYDKRNSVSVCVFCKLFETDSTTLTYSNKTAPTSTPGGCLTHHRAHPLPSPEPFRGQRRHHHRIHRPPYHPLHPNSPQNSALSHAHLTKPTQSSSSHLHQPLKPNQNQLIWANLLPSPLKRRLLPLLNHSFSSVQLFTTSDSGLPHLDLSQKGQGFIHTRSYGMTQKVKVNVRVVITACDDDLRLFRLQGWLKSGSLSKNWGYNPSNHPRILINDQFSNWCGLLFSLLFCLCIYPVSITHPYPIVSIIPAMDSSVEYIGLAIPLVLNDNAFV